MNAPETIYIRDHQVFMGHGIYRTEPWDDDIPYDRRKTCVWKIDKENGLYFTEHGWYFSTMDLEVRYFKWCPFCGGRVEITDGDDKENNDAKP